VSAALTKLDGVESVEVSFEKASAEIRLRAGNRVTLERIRTAIRDSGYSSRDAEITARGRIVEQKGKSMFDLLNGSLLELAVKPKPVPAGIVEITGVSKIQAKSADRLTIATTK